MVNWGQRPLTDHESKIHPSFKKETNQNIQTATSTARFSQTSAFSKCHQYYSDDTYTCADQNCRECYAADARAVVDPVVEGLLGIGEPSEAARRFQSQSVTDCTFPRESRGYARFEVWYADSEFHKCESFRESDFSR